MTDSGSYERPLLFGLLAFQNEFVSHAELLKAFSTWIADKSKTLDQILVEQGAISEEDRQLFSRLVEKHSAKFGGDARQSLCNLSELGSIRAELENLAASDPIALNTLSQVPAHRVHASTYQTILTESQLTTSRRPTADSASRFRIVRQHARGGLGVVFVAEDQDLRREVAMKQIRDDRADYEEYRIKFVHEAEVTGQLEHPGIVPVYALGVDAKGRPYYAMRFVRGEDLQTRIRSFHANRSITKSALDSSELRGLMRRYIDVCNAIQYAHDRGVLHRDLKPGNVMLGKHGETLVVDWGLAKSISDPNERDPTTTIAPHAEQPVGRSGATSGTETQAGSFIGTPAYAPPEQVLCQLEKLGPRSDVYSLGAILYELLTGKVPVSGTTVAEVITKATTGNFPAPRTIDASIPKPLEAICRKAMAIETGDRYESAAALRHDVENWLDDSTVLAYSEPWLSRLQRKVRKNPVAASWTAAVILMSLLATGGYGIVSSNYNRQLVEKNRRINEEKSAAEQARDAEELAKNAAVLAQSQAVGVRDFIVDIFRQPDPSRDGRTVTVYDSMVSGVRRVRRDFGNDPETAIALLTAIYQSYNSLGLYSDANELIKEVLEIRKNQKLDTTDAALETRNDLGKNLKLLGKYTQSIREHETLYQLCSETRGANHAVTLQVKHDLANAYRAAGRLQDALKANQEVFAARTRILGDEAPDVLSSQNTLANSLQAIGQSNEALRLRKVNFTAREKILGSNHPDTLSSQNNLGIALLETGSAAESLKVQTAAYQNRRRVLGLDHPDTLATLFNLANVLLELENSDRAEEMYTEAIAGLTASLSADHSSTLAATAGLGRVLEMQGEYSRAVTVLRKVYQAQVASLGESHPNTLAVANSLATALEKIGEIEQARQLLEDAASRSIAAVGETHELTVDLQLSLSALYFAENQTDQGLALCQKLAALTTDALGATHPKAIKARNNLALAYYVVGDLQNALSSYEVLEATEVTALGPMHRETIRTALGKILTLRMLKRTAIALTQAERVLAQARKGLGDTDALTLDAIGALGQLYLVANRPAEAKELLFEEYQVRTKKLGFSELSSVLAASYLVSACEQLEDWSTVKATSQRMIEELAEREEDALYVADFQFRLGNALSLLKETPAAAEQLMLSSLQLVESRAEAIAPPQLSPLEMEYLLHRYYVASGELEKAQAYSSQTKKVSVDIE